MNTYENEVAFTRTGDTYLGLSNLAPGFPVLLNGSIRIPTCEHLFQALKFPDSPELQRQILSQRTPVMARILAGRVHHKSRIRSDWKEIQMEVMAFCIRAKLIWNWVGFGNRLRESADKEILENSSKTDVFWGVVPTPDGHRGLNHLGILLTGLRDEYLSEDNAVLHLLTPPDLGLKLCGEELKVVDRRKFLTRFGTKKTAEVDQRWPYRVHHKSNSGLAMVDALPVTNEPELIPS
jgi:predicted NAD-dependent protein-ADP-ribosyltransferase YbiA (DUF1768 family)